MRLKITDLLERLGLAAETLYWGKRLVKPLPQPGAFKSHSVVAHWVVPERIRIDLRAGLSGKTLTGKDLAQYPLPFQTETFFEFAVEDDDAKDKKDGKGKAGSGGGAALRKKKDDLLTGFFAQAQDQSLPTHAQLARGVVMGMEIGKNALENVFDLFCQQLQAAKVLASDLLASAGKTITRYTPPPFMSPRGDEHKVYKYDRAKNETMFGVAPT
jgi:hypothetical protein